MTTPKTNIATDAVARTITVSRTFAAPRERVFGAFTTPEHLAHWWSPEGWTTETLAHALVPGGVWRYVMRGPGGMESRGKTTYREIDAPSRFVYSDAFADAEGNPIEGLPVTLTTVEFAEQDGKTTVTSITRFASEEDLQKIVSMGVIAGVTQTWERLATYLGGE